MDETVPGGGVAIRNKYKMRKNMSIVKEVEYYIDEELNVIEFFAQASFYIGKSNINTKIKSENKKILVEK